MPKARHILSERLASVIARGDAEIGFKPVSEILFVGGADCVGTIPEEVQQPTISGAASAREPEAARPHPLPRLTRGRAGAGAEGPGAAEPGLSRKAPCPSPGGEGFRASHTGWITRST